MTQWHNMRAAIAAHVLALMSCCDIAFSTTVRDATFAYDATMLEPMALNATYGALACRTALM